MDFAELAALASGHAEARAIQTALKLGIFDLLEQSPLDDAALAAAIPANRRATALIANAMVALGLLDKRAQRYSLTEAARRYLLRSSPEYLGGLILFDEAFFQTWTNLEQTIRTGLPARPTDMFQSRPEETERFIRAMDSLTRARGDAAYVAGRLDLSKVSTIADIGGGPGTYTVAMLRRWPHLRATIYDLPATLEVARKILAEREPASLARIDLVRFDYLYDEIPSRCGALFMSNIIHSEDETDNAQVMRKCFRALEPGGLIIIKDHIMNADLTEPKAGAIFALYLLMATRGRDYSFDEVSRWLGDAGFADIKHEVLPSPPFTSSMVIARKPL
ncbi:methyltransferase [Candidatus Binatus sp.]|uniref:methyltransferase n=1 Tax=Candidatus Binatus sp. TaxID=2811406 RepID=UPI003C78B180